MEYCEIHFRFQVKHFTTVTQIIHLIWKIEQSHTDQTMNERMTCDELWYNPEKLFCYVYKTQYRYIRMYDSVHYSTWLVNGKVQTKIRLQKPEKLPTKNETKGKKSKNKTQILKRENHWKWKEPELNIKCEKKMSWSILIRWRRRTKILYNLHKRTRNKIHIRTILVKSFIVLLN